MKVAIIGTGYVGLVAGACFAESGASVVCIDIDAAKVAQLQKAHVPFFEPGLSNLVARNHPHRLQFSTELASSISGCEIIFIAVGTPAKEDGSADLSHVLQVAERIAEVATREHIVVLKSTVPVGTNARVREILKGAPYPMKVCSNPEFLKEGDALADFLKPSRIVIGTEDDLAFERLCRLYAPFNRQRDRVFRMAPESAEVVKYAANALLATKISFMNDIAELSDAVSGDIEDVRVALGADPRIGYEFLYSGLGFGGSCFPKDLRALINTGKEFNIPLPIARAAIEANVRPVERLLQKMDRELGGFAGKKVAVWGLAFKPKTDDTREAPGMKVVELLLRAGAKVSATDPEALETVALRLKDHPKAAQLELLSDIYSCSKDADAIVVATEWRQFSTPDYQRLGELMRMQLIFDGRNMLSADEARHHGFRYFGMGRN